MKACFPIDILGSPLCPVDSVKNLGVWFDSDFYLFKHVQNVCKSCFVKLCDSRHVRQFITHDVSVLVANAVVSSRLDYCNSLFRSVSKFNLCKLQCVQNSAARIFQTPVNTPVQLLCLRNCFGFLLNSRQCLRQSHLFTSFFTPVFLGILLHIFPLTAVLTVRGAVKVVAFYLSF